MTAYLTGHASIPQYKTENFTTWQKTSLHDSSPNYKTVCLTKFMAWARLSFFFYISSPRIHLNVFVLLDKVHGKCWIKHTSRESQNKREFSVQDPQFIVHCTAGYSSRLHSPHSAILIRFCDYLYTAGTHRAKQKCTSVSLMHFCRQSQRYVWQSEHSLL